MNLFSFLSKNSSFDFNEIKHKTLTYVESLKVGEEIGVYKFSSSTNKPNIYASVYACLIRYAYDDLFALSKEEKQKWINYFNSFQSSRDGLFYDPNLNNKLYKNSDWWGARHLALHIIMAYKALDGKPKYKFYFLQKYYQKKYIQEWLDKFDWNKKVPDENDIDNKIMNIGCLLQYSRDYLNDKKAGQTVKMLMQYLEDKINPQTGMWGVYNLSSPEELSRMIQFAYHLFQLFFYDKHKLTHVEKIIDSVLKNQNKKGGFSPNLNSSACEDIDSTDLLIYFSKKSSYKNKEVKQALQKSFKWILSNINKNGGFVFRKNDEFFYGHEEMSTQKNESSLFPTWFRTTNIAHLAKYLNKIQEYKTISLPGYDF